MTDKKHTAIPGGIQATVSATAAQSRHVEFVVPNPMAAAGSSKADIKESKYPAPPKETNNDTFNVFDLVRHYTVDQKCMIVKYVFDDEVVADLTFGDVDHLWNRVNTYLTRLVKTLGVFNGIKYNDNFGTDKSKTKLVALFATESKVHFEFLNLSEDDLKKIEQLMSFMKSDSAPVASREAEMAKVRAQMEDQIMRRMEAHRAVRPPYNYNDRNGNDIRDLFW